MKPPVIDLTARESVDPPAPGTEETPVPAAKPKGTPRAKAAAEAVPPVPETPVAEATPPADRPVEPPAPPEKPVAEPAAPVEEKPAPIPPPPRPPARLAMPWSAISIAAAAGAVLGAALTYGLANWIALPDKGPAFADPAPALATLGARNDALEARLAELEGQARRTQVSLDATLAQIDALGAETRQSVADVKAAIPAPQTVDLSAIEAELQTLESTVAAIGAGASSADASTLAENLATIEQSVSSITTRIDAIESASQGSSQTLASLRAEVDAAKAAIAAQNQTLGGTEIGPAVRLPLIVSGLEAAFASGRPYAAELKSLTALLPNVAVPAPLAGAAESGLMRPDALVEQFEAAVPDILAGRTGVSTGDWGKDALEWAKALLALRPADEVEGETPEAIVSRLEGAVGRHDFTAAATLLAQLPEPMQAAAGDLGAAIAAHAAAEQFVAGLRAQALQSAAVTN